MRGEREGSNPRDNTTDDSQHGHESEAEEEEDAALRCRLLDGFALFAFLAVVVQERHVS